LQRRIRPRRRTFLASVSFVLHACVHLPAGPVAVTEAALPVSVASLVSAEGEDVGQPALATWHVMVRAGWRFDPIESPGMSWAAAHLLGLGLQRTPAAGGESAVDADERMHSAQAYAGPELLVLKVTCPPAEAASCAARLGAALATPNWSQGDFGALAEVARDAEAAALAPVEGRARAWLDGLALEGRAGATSGVQALARGATLDASALDAWWRSTVVRRSIWIGRSTEAAAGDAALLRALEPLSTAMPPDRPAARAPRPQGREGLWVRVDGPTTVAFGGPMPARSGEPKAVVIDAQASMPEVLLPGLQGGRHGATTWQVEATAAAFPAAWEAAEARLAHPSAASRLATPCGAFEAQVSAVWAVLTGDIDVCSRRPMLVDAAVADAWWRETAAMWSVVVVVGPTDPRPLVSSADVRWRVVEP